MPRCTAASTAVAGRPCAARARSAAIILDLCSCMRTGIRMSAPSSAMAHVSRDPHITRRQSARFHGVGLPPHAIRAAAQQYARPTSTSTSGTVSQDNRKRSSSVRQAPRSGQPEPSTQPSAVCRVPPAGRRRPPLWRSRIRRCPRSAAATLAPRQHRGARFPHQYVQPFPHPEGLRLHAHARPAHAGPTRPTCIAADPTRSGQASRAAGSTQRPTRARHLHGGPPQAGHSRSAGSSIVHAIHSAHNETTLTTSTNVNL